MMTLSELNVFLTEFMELAGTDEIPVKTKNLNTSKNREICYLQWSDDAKTSIDIVID